MLALTNNNNNNNRYGLLGVVLLLLLLLPSDAQKCPGSPVGFHAKCEMKVNFPGSSCQKVMEEIINRATGKNNWVDPHNGGTYTLFQKEEEGNDNDKNNRMVIAGSRLTGDSKYTDLFAMSFYDENDAEQEEEGCVMQACSESQVRSYLDYSTNYCNIHSLYCNSSVDNCPVITHEFDYVESFTDCWQNDASKCVSKKGNA